MRQDHFLSRWARRKSEVLRDAVEPPKPLAETIETSEGPVEEDAPTPDFVAELPSLDSLTTETDLTQFLKAGVPQALRNAALRRMWSIDPGIRDYLSEAREYAFDWHIPGAVPGTCPMLPTDDIASMVREVFAGSRAAAEDPAPARSEPEVEASSEADLPDEPLPAIAAEPSPDIIETAMVISPTAEPEPVRLEPSAPVGRRLRRHGGASPI